VVCPRIDATDTDTDLVGAQADDGADTGWSGLNSVTELAQRLAEGELSQVRVGVLHGRMPAEDKEAVMRRFAEHGSDGIDVLVATTVIEVGVDVPDATVMAVMDADRFGVSQLHQLRGRVGRGGHPGLCLLHTSSAPDSAGRARCEAVAATSDGFALAEVDLAQRREGDVLGAVQSGRRSSLQLLSVLADAEVIEAARHAADRVVAADPTLAGHPGLARVVAEWTSQDRLDYVDKG
jgi:ATP-dependent DNA helicase RecG